MPDADAAPVSALAFGRMMAALGPFEAKPHVAVAVSGDGDSMALCLLADGWARRRGGRVTALTVNHGLRPEAAGEARQVRRWLTRRGVAHRILPWRGPKPATGVQAAARAERYRLMTAWCRNAGVLHLLIAHHQRDQAETFLMRLARGSGADGLSAMAAIVEAPEVRLLRPLLGVAPGRLRATLRRRRQAWIEDPSNADVRFARTRVRRLLPELEPAGLGTPRLVSAAERLGRGRQALEEATAALLARCCAVHPAGFAWLDPRAFTAAPEGVSLRALARIIVCIGGGAYAPRLEKLQRLHGAVVQGRLHKSRTLGGCRLVAADRRFLVCREARNLPAPIAAVAGKEWVWDRRFVIALAVAGESAPAAARVTRLGRDGWRRVVADRPAIRSVSLPVPVRISLPALWDDAGVCAVPHLGYQRVATGASGFVFRKLAFRPPSALSPIGFFLA